MTTESATASREATAAPTAAARRMSLSIRGREIFALLLLSLCIVALSTAAHVYHAQQIVWNSTLREADLVARQIYEQCVRTLSRPTSENPRAVLSRDPDLRSLLDATVGYAPWLLYAAVVDAKGVAIAHSDRKREGEILPLQPSLRDLVSDHPLRRLFGRTRSEIYETALPFNVNGKPLATIRLGIAMPLLRGRLDDAFWYTVILGALALGVALVVALGLSSVTLKPIRKLAEDMERLRRGDFDVGGGAEARDEFGKLAYQLQLLGKQMETDRTRILAERSEIDSVHAAVDNLEDGILFAEANGLVLFANRSIESLLGAAAENAEGRPLDEVLSGEHPLLNLMRRTIDTGEATRNAQVEIVTDGKPRELLASVFPVSADGAGCAGAILVVRDVRAVAVSARTFQSLIQYSAQLAALGQITSEVAHDVKNPLHAMAVRVAFLRERIPNPTPDVVRSLDVLEREIQRAAGVVDRFMEVVYPSDLARAPVSLNPILQELATLLQAEWQAKDVVLTTRLEPDLPAVKGDEEMLRRALMNLLVNACQAMPGGGRVDISSELETEALRMTITDTGVGIPPEDIERIFKMYYTTKTDGTGIGLALVRRVVDLHHGSIEILSTVGQGTKVIVRLPVSSRP
jgi:PAS domain S-box-containing protein